MQFHRTYLIVGVVAAVAGLGAVAAIAHRSGSEHHGHRGFERGGGSGGMMGLGALGLTGPTMRFCRTEGTEAADLMLVRFENRIKPTDGQRTAFEDFKSAARAAATKMKAACPRDPAARPGSASGGSEPSPGNMLATRSPIERIAEVETRLVAQLEALKAFRPAAETFYSTLDDGQKARLAERGGMGRQRGFWNRRNDGAPSNPGGDVTPGGTPKLETPGAPSRS